MLKYVDRKTVGVTLSDIDHTDLVILERLAKTKKLTDAQKVALQRLLSAYYCSD